MNDSRLAMFKVSPLQFARDAACVGMAVAHALAMRGRLDVLRMMDRNGPFSTAIGDMVVQSWVSDAMEGKSDADLAKSFAALVDGAIAKFDEDAKNPAVEA